MSPDDAPEQIPAPPSPAETASHQGAAHHQPAAAAGTSPAITVDTKAPGRSRCSGLDAAIWPRAQAMRRSCRKTTMHERRRQNCPFCTCRPQRTRHRQAAHTRQGNLARHWALRMLTHGGASSHHRSGARRCGTARRSSPVSTGRPRNDSTIAPIVCAHRTQMTGWSNGARAAISGVLARLPSVGQGVRVLGAQTFSMPGTGAVRSDTAVTHRSLTRAMTDRLGKAWRRQGRFCRGTSSTCRLR